MGAGTDVDVQVAVRAPELPDEDTVRHWVSLALEAAGYGGGASTTVRIVDEAEIQALNRDYRDKDQPTNVLSFPAEAVEGLPAELNTELGDIVICAPVVAREAGQQGKIASAHWAHMLVHGTLHLLGFDHIDRAEAREMEQLERNILEKEGIADPYGDSG